ncbi:MAG TPA: DegQ family serine endoprotease [Burkholderiales bacterium]
MIRRTALLLVLLALAACDRTAPTTAPNTPASSPTASQTGAPSPGTGGVVSGLPDFTPLVERQGPAVVNVVTTRTIRGAAAPPELQNDPFFEFFRRFMPDAPERGAPEQRGMGLGSGFVISPDGYILTNAHVVADADDVTVRLADAKREYKAKVIGIDRRTDVALIKVDATGLPVITIGSSEKLKVGEWVAAIGSPFGFANTITAGIVSAKGRTLPDESYVPFIQTDVAVNPGNSGGPLLNLRGEVIGINSLIYSQTGGYMGLSFAIPIEVAIDVGKQLRTQGRVTRARLGVRVQEMTKELAQSFGLDSLNGALVAWVEPGSPAEKAGIAMGDVILKYNGVNIDSVSELPRLVSTSRPGAGATLEVWRKGARQQITATLGELPPDAPATKPAGAPQVRPNTLGLAVSELPPTQRKALGVDYGLVVEGLEGGASTDMPLRRGDIILAINQTRFSSLQQFNQILEQQKPGGVVALLVRRGEDMVYVPVKIRGG